MEWKKEHLRPFLVKSFIVFVAVSAGTFLLLPYYRQTFVALCQWQIHLLETPWVRGVFIPDWPFRIGFYIPNKVSISIAFPVYSIGWALLVALLLPSPFLDLKKKLTHLAGGTSLLFVGFMAQIYIVYAAVYTKIPGTAPWLEISAHKITAFLAFLNLHFGPVVLPIVYWLMLSPFIPTFGKGNKETDDAENTYWEKT